MLQPLIYVPASLLDGLVAYWKLDETSGTRVDSHGSNNLTDNGSVGSAAGVVGNAASFVPANSEYLSIPTSSFSASFTDEASLNLWVKRDLDIPLTLDTASFIGLGGHPFPDHYPFDNNTDYLAIFRTNRLTIFPRLSGVPDRTVWHMLTITTEPGTNGYKIYQNGVLEYQTSGEATVSLGTTLFLGRGTTLDRYYGGSFDEVGLWSRALTPAEITTLYNSGAGITFPF